MLSQRFFTGKRGIFLRALGTAYCKEITRRAGAKEERPHGRHYGYDERHVGALNYDISLSNGIIKLLASCRYEDGDDNMKKIIGEAMLKSQRGEKAEPPTL
jgi:hypothetical protein